jgi:N-acetylneuraminate synthase
MPQFSIGKRSVGDQHPVYFIADIAANHDGDLNRAIDLIHLAKEAGADAAKFQNFTAEKIVSDRGFKSMGGQQSHQSKWKKSVFEVYQGASVPWDWTKTLKEACDKVGIDYFSTPYDFGAIDMLDPFVSIYKVGSGDITWPETLRKIAGKNKPVFIAAGASTQDDVERAVDTILPINKKLALMQCNTNYTGNPDNFKHIHLNVLKAWQIQFPDLVLGLSDHLVPGDRVHREVVIWAFTLIVVCKMLLDDACTKCNRSQHRGGPRSPLRDEPDHLARDGRADA